MTQAGIAGIAALHQKHLCSSFTPTELLSSEGEEGSKERALQISKITNRSNFCTGHKEIVYFVHSKFCFY